MNIFAITATLTDDPHFKSVDETSICEMRVAERGCTEDSQLFIDVSVFGPSAKACREHLKKGSHVAIAGHLRFREWQTEDGLRRTTYGVAANRVEFLPTRQDSESEDFSLTLL